MWALTRRLIQGPEVLQILKSWKATHFLQSDCWALPGHLPLFRARPLTTPMLTLSAELLQLGHVTAVPLTALPARERRQLLRVAPPPAESESTPVTAYLTESGALRRVGGQREARFSESDVAWRASTIDDIFTAGLLDSHGVHGRASILCDAALLPTPPVIATLTLINAQETSNPFALDPYLSHTDMRTGAALPDALASSLTTVAAQFRYRSFRWLPAPSEARDADPLAVAAGAAGLAPHLVPLPDRVQLAHLSQLPVEEQRVLVGRLPRYALADATTRPFVLWSGRWVPASRLQLSRRLRLQDIPRLPLVDPTAQPLLWVAVEDADLPGIDGNPLCVVRYTRRSFFNEEQLAPVRPTPTTALTDPGLTEGMRIEPITEAPSMSMPR